MDHTSIQPPGSAITCPRCGTRYAQQAFCPACGHDPSGFEALTPVGTARMEGTFLATLIRMVRAKIHAKRHQDRRS
jgi:hypothetical protein